MIFFFRQKLKSASKIDIPVLTQKSKLTNVTWTILIFPPVFILALAVVFLFVLSQVIYIKGADAVGDYLARVLEYLLRLRKHKIIMSESGD